MSLCWPQPIGLTCVEQFPTLMLSAVLPADDALSPLIQVISKNTKQNCPKHRALGDPAGDQLH